MKTFEQWLVERATNPQTPTPQAQTPQDATQPSTDGQPAIAIRPSEVQQFINTTKQMTSLMEMNEAFAEIVQTAKAYHNNPMQASFLQQMVAGFKSLGENHQFNIYLTSLVRGVNQGKGYPEDVDITQPWNTGWENNFNADGLEGEHILDKIGNSTQLALGDLKNLSQFGPQSQRSVFSQ